MILITGCAGYIGKKLAKELLLRDRQVRGFILPGQEKDVKELVAMGLELVSGDVQNSADLDRAVSGIRIVYHLAGVHSSNQEKMYRICRTGTENLLNVCKRYGTKRVIIAGNGSVYGDCADRLVTETEPMLTEHFYGKMTKDIEELAQDSFYSNGLQVLILRIAEVYGQDRNNYVRRRAGNVLGSPYAYNSRIFIDDLIQILLLCESKLNPGEIYNIADDRAVSKLEFFQELRRIAGYALPEWTSLTDADERLRLSIHGLRAASLRMSNQKLKKELSYEFIFPDVIKGIGCIYAKNM